MQSDCVKRAMMNDL